MAITVSQVIADKGPSFVGDPRLTSFEEMACFYVGVKAFGDKADYAKGLIMLHWLTLEAQGGGNSTKSGSGAVGGIREEEEGKLRREFHQSFTGDKSDDYWKSTSFGSEYLAIRRACIFRARNSFVTTA